MKLLLSLRVIYGNIAAVLSRFLEPLALFFLRFTVAKVFLDSGLSKWDGFLRFNVDKYDLFLYEFFCPDPVRPGALLLCNSATLEYAEGGTVTRLIEILAVMAGVVEVVLPVLLIVGFLSRFAALGLLAMTMFIQLAVFPSWDHWINPASWWAVTLLMIVARGPGLFSMDRLLGLEAKR
jgi:putative oxidoreductase